MESMPYAVRIWWGVIPTGDDEDNGTISGDDGTEADASDELAEGS
jgi:hypothetical protein